VTVAGAKVEVDCEITDDAGVQQHLRVSGMKLDGYRFKGAGSLQGVGVRVSGRIDPADTTSPTPRVVGTFLASDGRAGRV
jgi:hypothetical protein